MKIYKFNINYNFKTNYFNIIKANNSLSSNIHFNKLKEKLFSVNNKYLSYKKTNFKHNKFNKIQTEKDYNNNNNNNKILNKVNQQNIYIPIEIIQNELKQSKDLFYIYNEINVLINKNNTSIEYNKNKFYYYILDNINNLNIIDKLTALKILNYNNMYYNDLIINIIITIYDNFNFVNFYIDNNSKKHDNLFRLKDFIRIYNNNYKNDLSIINNFLKQFNPNFDFNNNKYQNSHKHYNIYKYYDIILDILVEQIDIDYINNDYSYIISKHNMLDKSLMSHSKVKELKNRFFMDKFEDVFNLSFNKENEFSENKVDNNNNCLNSNKEMLYNLFLNLIYEISNFKENKISLKVIKVVYFVFLDIIKNFDVFNSNKVTAKYNNIFNIAFLKTTNEKHYKNIHLIQTFNQVKNENIKTNLINLSCNKYENNLLMLSLLMLLESNNIEPVVYNSKFNFQNFSNNKLYIDIIEKLIIDNFSNIAINSMNIFTSEHTSKYINVLFILFDKINYAPYTLGYYMVSYLTLKNSKNILIDYIGTSEENLLDFSNNILLIFNFNMFSRYLFYINNELNINIESFNDIITKFLYIFDDYLKAINKLLTSYNEKNYNFNLYFNKSCLLFKNSTYVLNSINLLKIIINNKILTTPNYNKDILLNINNLIDFVKNKAFSNYIQFIQYISKYIINNSKLLYLNTICKENNNYNLNLKNILNSFTTISTFLTYNYTVFKDSNFNISTTRLEDIYNNKHFLNKLIKSSKSNDVNLINNLIYQEYNKLLNCVKENKVFTTLELIDTIDSILSINYIITKYKYFTVSQTQRELYNIMVDFKYEKLLNQINLSSIINNKIILDILKGKLKLSFVLEKNINGVSVDVYIPELKACIFINGPNHYYRNESNISGIETIKYNILINDNYMIIPINLAHLKKYYKDKTGFVTNLLKDIIVKKSKEYVT